jgi:hypothetical protein
MTLYKLHKYGMMGAVGSSPGPCLPSASKGERIWVLRFRTPARETGRISTN